MLRTILLTLAPLFAAGVIATGAFAQAPIPGLYNSGVDDAAAPLPAGSIDPHYTLVGPASPAVAISQLPGNWVVPPLGALWIGPTEGDVSDPTGQYTYTIPFDLAGFELATAQISGQWTSDNSATMYLNGTDTGFSRGDRDWGTLSPFALDSGFVSGVNTLEFVVTNSSGGGGNPTGLLVADVVGTADLVEPSDPHALILELIEDVFSLGLHVGVERSLVAKLEAAERALERGNERSAMGSLNAFVNHVEAQRRKHIDETDADALIQSAQAIIALLETDGPTPETGLFPADGAGQPLAIHSGVKGATSRPSAIAPNPFVHSTTIRYELHRASLVNLSIHDVTGRLVRTIQSLEAAAGSHTGFWDGRDGSGTRLAAGTYFVRLDTGGAAETRKVVYLGGK